MSFFFLIIENYAMWNSSKSNEARWYVRSQISGWSWAQRAGLYEEGGGMQSPIIRDETMTRTMLHVLVIVFVSSKKTQPVGARCNNHGSW